MSADDALHSHLLALEQERGRALVARDAAALNRLFSEHLVHVHSTGERMDRTQLLRYVLEVLRFHEVTRGPLQLKVRGEVAVMNGSMHTRMQRVDRDELVSADSLVTQVWMLENGQWRQTHFHACRAAAEPR